MVADAPNQFNYSYLSVKTGIATAMLSALLEMLEVTLLIHFPVLVLASAALWYVIWSGPILSDARTVVLFGLHILTATSAPLLIASNIETAIKATI